MKIEFREAKNIITKSNIPEIDYVINPYTGCQHGCIYCYAVFMIRFTGHKGEKWGEFLDIKEYDTSRIKPAKYAGKSLLFSSVTDPYQPIEKKVEKTRQILQEFIVSEAKIDILTKSALFTRDIDLFQKISHIRVGCSLATLDPVISRKLEPMAATPEARLQAVKKVHDAGIHTFLFLSPIFPGITDYHSIIESTQSFVDEYWFENLNFRPHNKGVILEFIKDVRPELLPQYHSLIKNPTEWNDYELELRDYCDSLHLNYSIEFHHGGFNPSKSQKKTHSKGNQN